jgi:hypothetical protein
VLENIPDVDLALPGRQTLRSTSVKQFLRRVALLHRGIADMHERQARGRQAVKLLDRAARAIEVQRIDQDANLCSRRSLDNPDGRAQVGDNRPWKELQYCAEAMPGSQIMDGSEPVGQPGEVRVVGSRDDVFGAEFAPATTNGSRPATSISGVIFTNSMSSTRMPVSARAAWVARIIARSCISG